MKQLFTIIFLWFSISAHAQEMLGIANSNYAGTTGLSLNPSTFVDSRIGFEFNLVTAGVSADNDYLFFSKDSLRFFGFKHLVDLAQNRGYSDKFEMSNKTKTYNASIFGLVRGPSALFHCGKDWFAVQTVVRGGLTISDVLAPIAKFAYEKDGLHYGPLHNETFDVPEFKIGAMVWGELGFTYGRELLNKNNSYIKGAFTLKRLYGYAGGYAINEGLSFKIDTGLYQGTGDSVFYINNAHITYGHTWDEYVAGSKYRKLVNGSGWGFDIGFTYEYRPEKERSSYEMDGQQVPDPTKNQYKWRFGASLIDVGKITFIPDGMTFDMNGKSAAWVGWDTVKTKNTADFDSTNSNIFFNGSPFGSRVKNKYNIALPRAYSLQFDYHLGKKFYANATWVQRMQVSGPQVVANNIVGLTPRYETKNFEVSMPLSLYQMSEFRAGVAVRVWGFMFGSDKLASLLGLTDLGGMDVYTSVKVPFGRHKIKDKDGDAVSDVKDKCPDDKGTWATMGCPDRDGDGITDKEDQCPDLKGLAQFKGCPDTDGDGIPDKDDDCPTIAGLAEFKGCPDTDGDAIMDKLDSCPDVKGLAQFNGCPDTDSDGLTDKLDSCPLVAGPVSNNGCPVIEKVVVKPAEPVKVELSKEEQEVINKVFKNLEFETGKWVIRPTSFASLDELAGLMQKKPNFKLVIEGHTDNVGNAKSNMQLSRNRAEAVKTYLSNKGVDSSRITATGYGLTKPVASNKTAEGRQKNRRVEFTIME